jgi:hypothetical protein
MEVISTSLDEETLYRSNMATYLARTVGKLLGPEDALSPEGKEALKSDQWNEYVGLMNGHQANEISPLAPPQLPQEFFQQDEKVQNDIRENTGTNELMRGMFPDKRRTATETNEVVSASSARQSEKRNVLERFYMDIAWRILSYIQLFYDKPRLSRMVDLENFSEVEWEWTADDVVMEADLEINLTPKEPNTREDQHNLAIELINTYGPIAQVPGSPVDLEGVVTVAAELMGLDKQTIMRILTTKEERQQEQQEALQVQQQQAQAGAGETPQPMNTPGPMSGADLAQAVNPGEVPGDQMAAIAGATPTA